MCGLLVARGLLPLDRMMGDFDIHRTIWIRDNVIHELEAVLPCPRGVQKSEAFNSRSAE